MNKCSVGFMVAVLTFLFGVAFVWLLPEIKTDQSSSVKIESSQNCQLTSPNTKKNVPTNPNGKVEIRFKQFARTESKIIAEFEIINHNSEPAYYSSYAEQNPNVFIKFNGIRDGRWYCGTGTKQFALAGGDSFAVKVHVNEYSVNLRKKGDFQVGYVFRFGEERYQEFWSEKLQLPESCGNAVETNEMPNRFKNRDEAMLPSCGDKKDLFN